MSKGEDVWILSMIKAIADERSIWNKADDGYKKTKMNAKAWQRVVDKVNDEVEWEKRLTGDDLKPKWTHYRREYLRDKPTGSAATDGDDDEKETKFGEALSFLRERVVHRSTTSNMPPPPPVTVTTDTSPIEANLSTAERPVSSLSVRSSSIEGDQDDDEFTPSSSRGTKRRNTSSSSRYLSILERLADQSKLPYAEYGESVTRILNSLSNEDRDEAFDDLFKWIREYEARKVVDDDSD